MARLTVLKPALSASVRTAPLAELRAEQSRDALRYREQPWRAWYNTAEWKALRREVIRRDRWTCQQTGVLCIGKANTPNAPVIDHILPHRGDRDLFFDIANLQLVAKAWHDGEKQRRERAGWA
jgi:5-methylcytosine-specific restriction endonuclease McrA